jgi:hypothetical protein
VDQTRLIPCIALALGLLAGASPAPAATLRAKFMTYGTEAQCVGEHILTPFACRSAFARARGAFEADTTAYPTLQQCAKAYGSCAPWPPGSRASFRPPFQGVDIVDTPGEKSVTPASPVRALRFAALPLSGPVAPPRELTVRGGKRASIPVAPPVPQGRASRPVRPSAAAAATSRPVAPPPGSGFKMENGVLTYPAPERFQPRNLPKVP